MKYSEVGFRAVYHQFCVVPMTEKLRKAARQYPEIDRANCLLVYGYIDHDAGLTLEILAGAREDGESFEVFDTNPDVKSMIRIDAVEEEEYGMFEDEDDSLKNKYAEKLNVLSCYDVPDDVERTREMAVLDASRHPQYPDDIQVYLYLDGLDAEVCWARISGIDNNRIIAILLNEPKQNFGCHAGDKIKVGTLKVDDGDIVCCADL